MSVPLRRYRDLELHKSGMFSLKEELSAIKNKQIPLQQDHRIAEC
ncbi:hypothetical protein SSAG_06581 [Streptomyces sp. Mg1]|nr:hypothetical protein SSAG_06581 [Streptomyces sp. Mg1]